MTRPSGVIPQHSSTALYPAGILNWSLTPTKIDPGTATLAAGYEPKKRMPAQFFNWLLNRFALFLISHDAIEVQNWTDKGAIGIGAVNASGNGKACTYDPTTNLQWIFGSSVGTPKVYFCQDPVNWIEDTTNLGVTQTVNCTCAAVNPTSGAMWAGGFAQTNLLNRTAAGTWTSVALPTSTGCLAIDFVAVEPTKFFGFFGNDNNGHPAMWRAADTGASIATVVVTNAATYTGRFVLHAHGPTRSVAFAVCTAPVAEYRQWDTDVWTNAFTDRGTVGFASNPVSLIYGSTDGLFMVTCTGGQVYTSPDGINWTLKATLAGATLEPNCLAVRGAVWVAVASITPGPYYWILWSTDAGVTWNRVPYPVDPARVPIGMTTVADAFLLIAGSTSTRSAISLRCQ